MRNLSYDLFFYNFIHKAEMQEGVGLGENHLRDALLQIGLTGGNQFKKGGCSL